MPTPRRALIVIDVQNEYFSGRLRIEYPAPALSLANIGRAMDGARQAGIPVIVIQHTAPAGVPVFQRDTHNWALHTEIAARPRDHHFEKHWPSAFTGTDLAAWLAERYIDTLSVVGYMTQNCVDSTIKEAMHRGLAAECLIDATGTLPYANSAGRVSAETVQHTQAVIFQSNFAAVLSTDEWLSAVADQRAVAPDNVLMSYERAQSTAA
ncbi:MAG: cysteine hydrolase family protein [Rhodocyclaceae bacterium]